MSINHTTHRSEIESFARANCSKIVSSLAVAASASASGTTTGASTTAVSDPTCMFTCKICGRNFSSFQALGGHRASHKKVNSAISGDSASPTPVKTPKRHACKICGKEFLMGQALGGHMRLHQKVDPPASDVPAAGGSSTVTTEGSNEDSEGNNCYLKKTKNYVVFLPVSENCRKRTCLDLGPNTLRSEYESEIEEREVAEDDEKDFLKLELRQPNNN